MDGIVALHEAREENEMPIDRVTLPKGDVSRRLGALGWSMRAMADEIGEGEKTLRLWDQGVPARADFVAWLEREERHRAKNPPPVRDAARAVGAGVKRRKRPAGSVKPSGKAEQVEASAEADQLVPSVKAERAEVDPEVALLVAAFGVPEAPPLVPLFPRPEGQSDGDRVKLVLDWLGWSPRELAVRMGAPAVARDIRRWVKGRAPVKPEVMAWVEQMAVVVSRRPAANTAWHRAILEHQRLRGEVERRMNEAQDALMRQEPPDDDRWEQELNAAAMKRPAWMGSVRDEVVDPKRPVRLDEIL